MHARDFVAEVLAFACARICRGPVRVAAVFACKELFFIRKQPRDNKRKYASFVRRHRGSRIAPPDIPIFRMRGKIYHSDTRYFFRKQKRDVGRRVDTFLSNLIIIDFLLLFARETRVRRFVESYRVFWLMKTFAKKRGKKGYVARWVFARNALLREVNERRNEGKRENSKNRWFEQKAALGGCIVSGI